MSSVDDRDGRQDADPPPKDSSSGSASGASAMDGAPGRTPELPGATRAVDVSSVAELLLGIPWLLWSLAVLVFFGGIIDERWGWIIALAWLMTGPVTLWRPAEGMIAQILLRLRKPTMREQQRLDLTWPTVARTAGVDGSKYSLWIEETAGVSAIGAAGQTIAVTRWAVSDLPPTHLEAVLAHELGHRLAGHSWASLLSYWYSLPARAAVWLVRGALRAFISIPLLGCLLVGFLMLAFAGLILNFLVFGREPWMPILVFIPILVAPVVLARFSRLSEMYADKTAARLGYGPPLLEVLYRWQAQGPDAERRAAGRKAEMMSPHPSVATRIRALEQFLTQSR